MSSTGFNPKARWDRRIPGTKEPLDTNRIEVLACFKQGKIYPRKFIWNNKEYNIENITYHWQERQGQEVLNFFSVCSSGQLYQISFSNASYCWSLNQLL
jgi:hypothetical protein